MKILIIQLARLGDIFQTWPVARALKNKYPEAQIDFLCRDRFSGAVTGLEVLSNIYCLSTKMVFGPVIQDHPQIMESVEELSHFAREVKSQNYDLVINLSFSQFSSYLSGVIRKENTQVFGYCRLQDGLLYIPDDVSAYFMAQVGIGRANRLHVTDLFAGVAGVQLSAQDWCPNENLNRRKQIVVHIGASQREKSVSASKWRQIILDLIMQTNYEIFLIGSDQEQNIASEIMQGFEDQNVFDVVGKCSLQQSMQLISESELLIGCDSAPVHMAALSNTRVLNISFSSVNFFETGPKSSNSRILFYEHPDFVEPQKVAGQAIAMLHHIPITETNIQVVSPTESYVLPDSFKQNPAWMMLGAVYLEEDFDSISDSVSRLAMLRLHEVNQLALDVLKELKQNINTQFNLQRMNQCDSLMNMIEKSSPEIGVLVRWFLTEKLRLKPGSMDQLIADTENIHNKLQTVLNLYPLEHWYQQRNGVLYDKDILDEA